MDSQKNAELKVYEEKVTAQLREVKAKIDEFEAQVKRKGAAAEVQAINTLNTKHQEIEKKAPAVKDGGRSQGSANQGRNRCGSSQTEKLVRTTRR